MLKIIAGLSLVILLSGGLNYWFFTESKKDAVTISNLENSNKDLQKQIDKNKEIKALVEDTYDGVSKKVESSSKSFDNLKNRLATIDCPKPVTNIGNSNEPIKQESDDSSVITNYYDILHSAYNLQNSN